MNSKIIAVKALIQATIFGLVILFVLLLLNAAQVFLILYAGILLAVLLHSFSQWVAKHTGMPERVSLVVAILLPLAIFGVGAWFIAPKVADQFGEMTDSLPKAADHLKQQLLQYGWIARLWQNKLHWQQVTPRSSSSMDMLTGFFSSTLGVAGNIIFAAFVGLFLAINPSLYVRGVLHLFPKHRRSRALQVLAASGTALREWLVAKLIAMAAIGALTAIGLWLLGIDLVLVLGLIAAVLSFIPNFGPIASVVPAALIALIDSPEKALYVLLLYAGVQAFETYLLTPMLQKRMVDLPPVLSLTTQVLLGVLAGILGVILATPLTAAAMVMIKMWYVDDLLEDGDKPGQ